MKNLGLRFLGILALIIGLVACAAQKQTSKAAESAALYQQALKALDGQQFRIEADEVYFSTDRTPVSSPDSYLSLQDGHAVISFAQKLSDRIESMYGGPNARKIEGTAALRKEAIRRNGDTEYILNVKGDVHWLSRKVLITLYKDSNKCFVRINAESSGAKSISFSGHVYPLTE